MAAHNGARNAGQIAMGFDPVQLAGLDQRRKDGPVQRTCLMAREEDVLAAKNDERDGAFDCVGIPLDPAIGQEQD